MIEKLKEYKEIITIIVFFLGGFFWIQERFPSKDDHESLRCLLDQYMELTQVQMSIAKLDNEIGRLDELRKSFHSHSGSAAVPLSPAMKYELEKIESDLDSNLDQLRDKQRKQQKIREDLEKDVCGKVES